METNQTIELKVNGMSCGHCVRAVQEALEGVPGVDNVSVVLEPGHATVMGGPELDAAPLIAAIREEGYDAERA